MLHSKLKPWTYFNNTAQQGKPQVEMHFEEKKHPDPSINDAFALFHENNMQSRKDWLQSFKPKKSQTWTTHRRGSYRLQLLPEMVDPKPLPFMPSTLPSSCMANPRPSKLFSLFLPETQKIASTVCFPSLAFISFLFLPSVPLPFCWKLPALSFVISFT